MTLYDAEFTDDALKFLRGCDKPLRRQLGYAIHTLQEDPRQSGVERLQEGKKKKGAASLPKYRLRKGDYRIIFSVLDDEVLIYVINVGPRGSIYRTL